MQGVARVRDGKGAADLQQQEAAQELAQELGLPVDEQRRVLYPDTQLEYTDALDESTSRSPYVV